MSSHFDMYYHAFANYHEKFSNVVENSEINKYYKDYLNIDPSFGLERIVSVDSNYNQNVNNNDNCINNSIDDTQVEQITNKIKDLNDYIQVIERDLKALRSKLDI